MKRKPTIVIDFDGAICENKFPDVGEPIEGVREALNTLKNAGFHITIHSRRTSTSLKKLLVYNQFQWIEDYMEYYKLHFDDIWMPDKPIADTYVDSKAVKFDNNWEEITEDIILKGKNIKIDYMYKDRERRKYKRIENPYMARFQVRQYEGNKTVSTDWDMAAVKDLSAGGILFIYNKNLGFDSLLDFKIDISESTPTIKCVGKVTRIEQSQSRSMLRIASEFTEIGEQEKEMINTTVEGILK